MSKGPCPDGVVAYHAALSRLRPGFKSRSGRHSLGFLRLVHVAVLTASIGDPTALLARLLVDVEAVCVLRPSTAVSGSGLSRCLALAPFGLGHLRFNHCFFPLSLPLRQHLQRRWIRLDDIGGALDCRHLEGVEPKGAAIGTAVEFDGLSSVILALLGLVRYYIEHDDTQHDGGNRGMSYAAAMESR